MILIVLLIAAAAVLIWERLMRRALAEAVEVTLDADASEINAGEELGFTETVVNRGVMPVPVMEIRFRIGKGLRFMNAENITESDYLYKRDVFSLLSHEQITREYRVLGEKRGFYQVSGADISMRAVPSFNEYVRALDADLSFYVYARRVPVRDILAASSLRGSVFLRTDPRISADGSDEDDQLESEREDGTADGQHLYLRALGTDRGVSGSRGAKDR